MAVNDDLPTLPPDDAVGFVSITRTQVQQSLDAGDNAAAEGFVFALLNRLGGSETTGKDPLSRACIDGALVLAEQTGSRAWADRVFRMHAEHKWTMLPGTMERVDRVAGMLGDMPKEGLRVYQRVLGAMAGEGTEIPRDLTAAIERWLSSG
jgi:hypothetical protein